MTMEPLLPPMRVRLTYVNGPEPNPPTEPSLVTHIPDAIAVIVRAEGGQWGSPCDRPPTRRALWRFERPAGATRILLCDEHAAELAEHERLTLDG